VKTGFLELNFVGVVPVVTLRLCSWSQQEPPKKIIIYVTEDDGNNSTETRYIHVYPLW
jgi:hypothetical protein